MKKVVSTVLGFVLVFSLFVNPIHAFNQTQMENSYEKVLQYYSNIDTLYGLDELIALGNAGVDLSSYTLASDYSGNCIYMPLQSFEDGNGGYNAGSLSKHILASIFLKKNPKNIEGKDLVSFLEELVENDLYYAEGNDADNVVWVLYALLAVEASEEHITKVADKLVSYQILVDTSEDRDNDRGGFDSAWGVSLDTVGYVIEALTLTKNEKYKANIEEALAYLKRKQSIDGGYDPNDTWGYTPPNTDTQCSCLQGLLVYDKEGVLTNKYDAEQGEVSDIALFYQNKDGSFINGGWDSEGWSAETGIANSISTGSALRMLSTYKNGSFVLNAMQIYKELNSVKAPETRDTSNTVQMLFLLILSLFVLSKGRQYE